MEDPKLTKLSKMLELLDNQLTPEDFTDAFEKVMKYTQDAHGKTKAEVDKILSSLDELFNGIRSANDKILNSHKNEMSKSHQEFLRKMENAVSTRLSELKDGEKGKDGKNANENAIFVRVLERLAQKKEKKLTLAEIEGWNEFFDEFRKVKERPVAIGGWSSAGGGKIVKSYDLSSSLNGVLTTFSLPAFWRVISVHLSSVPNILQPTTDYTVDGTLMQITFTNTINAATSLAAGQTCLVVYSEP